MPEEGSSIDRLPEMMGYMETEELRQLRRTIVEALSRGEGAMELLTRYHLLAEAIADQRDGMDRVRAQIGLTVQMGLIRRDGGRTDESYEDLKDAYVYASNVGLDLERSPGRPATRSCDFRLARAG